MRFLNPVTMRANSNNGTSLDKIKLTSQKWVPWYGASVYKFSSSRNEGRLVFCYLGLLEAPLRCSIWLYSTLPCCNYPILWEICCLCCVKCIRSLSLIFIKHSTWSFKHAYRAISNIQFQSLSVLKHFDGQSQSYRCCNSTHLQG